MMEIYTGFKLAAWLRLVNFTELNISGLAQIGQLHGIKYLQISIFEFQLCEL